MKNVLNSIKTNNNRIDLLTTLVLEIKTNTMSDTVIIKSSIDKIKRNYEKELSIRKTEYDRKRIMRRAWYLLNNGKANTFAEALRQSWSESKVVVIENRKEIARLKNVLLNTHTPPQLTELNSNFTYSTMQNIAVFIL